MKITQLKNNPRNPRKIEPAKLDKLVESIRTFPEMMDKRPMVCVTDVDGKLYPLGGNQRLKAIKQLDMKEIPDSWVMLADDWTEEQRQEFLIKDNVAVGTWDFDELKAGWDLDKLEEWGLEIPNWDAGVEQNEMTDEDVDIEEEFDPIGVSAGQQRVVFIFDGSDEAESYLKSINVEFVKRNMAWQVDMSTQSILSAKDDMK
jgi:hypothetical protein